MTTNRKVKVFELDFWMKDEKHRQRTLGPERHAIDPVFHRDGIYFDRIKDIAWFEYGGMAWSMSPADVTQLRWKLGYFLKPIMSADQIKTFAVAANKAPSKSLRRELHKIIRDNENAMLVQGYGMQGIVRRQSIALRQNKFRAERGIPVPKRNPQPSKYPI